ncbi:unnamed protein product [Vitrella brassicaformis CCMP3155]|uniref:Uncharacterized protein n=2 Tax=Vitrella brassicaformis TaxID=1169539 RepID=A0A0G4EAL4_VITBC|nr:unnamed protein product [Vitrella brassicaformis CCMP3155]|eukprot:CEL92294.1 unnamed protein product [Vitrella brassicaformis CCMP3155]
MGSGPSSLEASPARRGEVKETQDAESSAARTTKDGEANAVVSTKEVSASAVPKVTEAQVNTTVPLEKLLKQTNKREAETSVVPNTKEAEANAVSETAEAQVNTATVETTDAAVMAERTSEREGALHEQIRRLTESAKDSESKYRSLLQQHESLEVECQSTTETLHQIRRQKDEEIARLQRLLESQSVRADLRDAQVTTKVVETTDTGVMAEAIEGLGRRTSERVDALKEQIRRLTERAERYREFGWKTRDEYMCLSIHAEGLERNNASLVRSLARMRAICSDQAMKIRLFESEGEPPAYTYEDEMDETPFESPLPSPSRSPIHTPPLPPLTGATPRAEGSIEPLDDLLLPAPRSPSDQEVEEAETTGDKQPQPPPMATQASNESVADLLEYIHSVLRPAPCDTRQENQAAATTLDAAGEALEAAGEATRLAARPDSPSLYEEIAAAGAAADVEGGMVEVGGEETEKPTAPPSPPQETGNNTKQGTRLVSGIANEDGTGRATTATLRMTAPSPACHPRQKAMQWKPSLPSASRPAPLPAQVAPVPTAAAAPAPAPAPPPPPPASSGDLRESAEAARARVTVPRLKLEKLPPPEFSPCASAAGSLALSDSSVSSSNSSSSESRSSLAYSESQSSLASPLLSEGPSPQHSARPSHAPNHSSLPSSNGSAASGASGGAEAIETRASDGCADADGGVRFRWRDMWDDE